MTPVGIARALTARGWGAVALLLAAGLFILTAGSALGLRWDPFGLDRRRLEAARAEAAHARADADARRFEQAAEVEQRRRLDAFHDRAAAVDHATAAAVNQARLSDEADEPLQPRSVLVLRAHDDELRRLAPHLGG